jgi:hypothetical protein
MKSILISGREGNRQGPETPDEVLWKEMFFHEYLVINYIIKT